MVLSDVVVNPSIVEVCSYVTAQVRRLRLNFLKGDLKMSKLVVRAGDKVVRVTGDVEMSYSDQEAYDAKYAAVDMVFIGDAKQIALMINRLHAGFDGGVDEEELEVPPTRPTRALQKGDFVEWVDSDGSRREGKFHHEDCIGRGYVSLIDVNGEVYVRMRELHYLDVDSKPYPKKVAAQIVAVLEQSQDDGYTAVEHVALREQIYAPSDTDFARALDHLVKTKEIVRSTKVLTNGVTYALP